MGVFFRVVRAPLNKICPKRLSLSNFCVTGLEFSVARDAIVFNLVELIGNIWLAEVRNDTGELTL